jgi:tetratricopeptide (TPR) repeat protein
LTPYRPVNGHRRKKRLSGIREQIIMRHGPILVARAGLVALTIVATGAAASMHFASPAFANPGSGGGSGGGGSGGGGSGGSSGGGGEGGGGSSGNTGSGGAGGVVCYENYTFDPKKGVCVKNSALNDWQLYDQGRLLALAGHYREALGSLQAVRNQNDAMVLTMIGYATRKLGDVNAGIAYYQRALSIEPDNVNTREYLGEGYVSLGRLDLAQGELDRIEKLCGTECDQYIDLAAAMAGETEWR